MISKWLGAMFALKHPRGYTGRHRAEAVAAPASSPAPAVPADSGAI